MSNTFMERLVAEKLELNGKLNKLAFFIQREDTKGIVGEVQFDLLVKQRKIMESYLAILTERIKLLEL
ncbi:crAss001_48 related protein [Xenorhabdus bovienii]|uniref:crAss001_48 related protein n=1 Tax=Xenorhabdus bovienii TaxID=40576 RepID=UPI003DA38048